MITFSYGSGILAALAVLLLGLTGAVGALLLRRYRRKNSPRRPTVASEPRSARATNSLVWAEDRRASTSGPALEFASEKYPSRLPQPSVAGEQWVREYVRRLRDVLPGSCFETPAPVLPVKEEVVELDSEVCAVLDEDDDVGVLCASSVVLEDRPSPSPANIHATEIHGVLNGPSPAHAKTLILGAMHGLAGLDAPLEHPAPQRARRTQGY
jgi:hypothetical protein